MPSDQQKLYEYASNMARLLSSNPPEDYVVIWIAKLVVSKIIQLIAKPYLARRSQHSYESCIPKHPHSCACNSTQRIYRI